MNQYQLRRLLLMLVAFQISGCVAPGPAQSVTIEDRVESFENIERAISVLDDKYGASEVLVVLDIDNTLLTSSTDLGGDIWYQWQRGRLDVKPTNEQEVPCLFEDAIGLLYELGPMRLTDESLPSKIQGWQDRGITVFALTSRSPKYRAATERELTRLRIDFRRTPLASSSKPAPVFREMADREWSYMNGIMMTTGMNKGTMLTTLLHRIGKRFSAIVFVDDTRRHVEDVFSAYQTSNQSEVHIFHFTKIEAEREHRYGSVLTPDQAEKMAADWNKLSTTLNSIFPFRVLSTGCLGS